MYLNHFGLKQLPFENTPDPDCFFMGARYRETLALMKHGVIARKGLMCITGPIGSGKSTLAIVLTENLPEQSIVLNISHPGATPLELGYAVSEGLGLKNIPDSPLKMTDAIKAALIEKNRAGFYCVMIIDEAHLMQDALFETILVLTNLETREYKLLQILLLGQRELLDKLGLPRFRQLLQRISLNKIMEPMNKEQSVQYIQHRFKKSGGSAQVFDKSALYMIADTSGGLPRRINTLCDAALLSVFIRQKKNLDSDDVIRAAGDIGLDLHDISKYQIASRIRRGQKWAGIATQGAALPHDREAAGSLAWENLKEKKKNYNETVLESGETEEFDRTFNNDSNNNRKNKSEFRVETEGKTDKKSLKTEEIKKNSDKTARRQIKTEEYEKDFKNSGNENSGNEIPGTDDGVEDEQKSSGKKKKKIPIWLIIPAIIIFIVLAVAYFIIMLEGVPEFRDIEEIEPVPIKSLEKKSISLKNIPDKETLGQSLSGKSLSGKKVPVKETPAPNQAFPYSVLLASFRSFESTRKASREYRKKGLLPYWVRLDMGKNDFWYGIFTGYFEDMRQARSFIKDSLIKGAIVNRTQYAVYIDSYQSDENLQEQMDELEKCGFSSYVIVRNSGARDLFVGAFSTLEGVTRQYEELTGEGILCNIAER